jgi:hypothetical protein
MSKAFFIIVNVFLGLIIKRLLDSFLDVWKSGGMKAHNWFAGITLVVILSHTFVICIKLVSTEYTDILDRADSRIVLRMFTVTMAILVVLYLMADLFSGDIDAYLIWAGCLAWLWLLFDVTSSHTLKSFYVLAEREGELNANPLFQVVVAWMFCDCLLIIYMIVIWVSYHSARVDSRDAGLLLLITFTAIAYLVQHSLSVGSRVLEMCEGDALLRQDEIRAGTHQDCDGSQCPTEKIGSEPEPNVVFTAEPLRPNDANGDEARDIPDLEIVADKPGTKVEHAPEDEDRPALIPRAFGSDKAFGGGLVVGVLVGILMGNKALGGGAKKRP